jgi:peptidoglycan/LPS O-acetylase OafA/YrhL
MKPLFKNLFGARGIAAFGDYGRSWRNKLVLTMVFFLVAAAGVKLNPGFAGYVAIWFIGAFSYYYWNEDCCRNRALECGVIIICAVLLHIYLDSSPVFSVIRDMLITIFIAWILFKLRLRLPAPQFLTNCSYSLYVTHFPVLLLIQSLLIFTGSTSVSFAIVIAVCSVGAALLIGLIGGAIEARKATVQNAMLWLIKELRIECRKTS